MKKRNEFKAALPLLLMSFLLLPACSSGNSNPIHLPVKTPSEVSPSKEETKWSRVRFGSYPAKEIVNENWNAVDEYALDPGDILKDNKLYQMLVSASWSNNATIIDGKRYIREENPSKQSREQHYRYDESAYHYFEVEPLRWRVVGIEGDVLTLVSDRTIDCIPFHQKDESVDWSSSSLRKWLNDDRSGFLSKAFDADEKEALVKVNNTNPANSRYGTSSGPQTEDYVYILSNDEVFASEKGGEYGFYPGFGYDDPAKRFRSTTYAKYHGTWWSPVEPYKGNSFWQMRTSGYTSSNITYICDFGYIYSRGTSVDCDDAGVLPVINVNSKKCSFREIDEVSSLAIMKQDSGGGKENTCHPEEITPDHKVTEFGEYPQSEVVSSLPSDDQEGYIVDQNLYEELKLADWNEAAIIQGNEYEKVGDQYFKVEPIKWKILDEKDGKSLLFPLKGLDVTPFNKTLEDTYWANSYVRGWLNEEFTKAAFGNQLSQVEETEVINKKNFYFDTYCGEKTVDRLFLLSEEEVFSSEKASSYGFACSDAIEDSNRMIQPTRYALSKGAWASSTDGNSFWMLRTNGYNASNTVYVNDDGNIYNRGMPVTCQDAIVMPACWVSL